MLIHAFKRKEPTPIELFGLNIEFLPNAQGHCVAEVDDEAAIDRLLSISEAFCVYGEPAVQAVAPVEETDDTEDAPTDEPEAVSLTLTNDAGETLDISTFTAKKVREFAAENGITLPSGNRTPVAELRQLLAQGLTAKG
jgi:hypothetical protein